MVDFAKLAAEARARRLAAEAAANGPEVSDAHTNDSEAHGGVSESAPAPASVPPEAQPTAGETQRRPNPFARPKDTGSGDSARPVGDGPPASSGNDSGGEQPKSGLSALSLGAGTSDSDSNPGVVAAPAITTLDSLDQSEDAGIAPRQGVSHFADETPADKPTRELPEGLTKEQLGFVDMIDGVYEVIHEPDLMGGVIRNIIIELKSNPEYMKLVAPEDIRTWVRGMRDSMGLTKIKKTESKAKRSGGAGKKSKLVDDDMLSDLADLGVDIPT